MVLHADCVRQVLLAIEACSFGERPTLDSLGQKIPDFSREDIWYTCLKLEEGGYLELVTVPGLRMPMPGIKEIKGMTYYGHEFLNSIREDGNWAQIKAITKKAGVSSLSLIGEVAKQVAQNAILSALQQHL